jgi:hypothetical protein
LTYDAPGFTARVARDGSVSFRDKHVSSVSLFPWLPRAGAQGVPTLEGILRGLGARAHAKAVSSDSREDPPIDASEASRHVSRFRPDTREICRYPSPCFGDAPMFLLGLAGRIDITDELMRIAGQDPYRYQKARFLGATRELRIVMAGRAHAADVRRSSDELPVRLKAIACDEQLTASERRAIIQALRRELDDATPEGRAAGELIDRFLQAGDRADGGTRCSGK